MTFCGYVKYKSHEMHITMRGKLRTRYCKIRVQCIETNRIYYLYDWSGKSHVGTLMRNHRHEVFIVHGFLNIMGYALFPILQRWGIWDVSRRLSTHPVTREPGYIEVPSGKEK